MTKLFHQVRHSHDNIIREHLVSPYVVGWPENKMAATDAISRSNA